MRRFLLPGETKPILGEKGYKGKGMCKLCWYSELHKVGWLKNPQLYCAYYTKWCKLVCRNCIGIKDLK